MVNKNFLKSNGNADKFSVLKCFRDFIIRSDNINNLDIRLFLRQHQGSLGFKLFFLQSATCVCYLSTITYTHTVNTHCQTQLSADQHSVSVTVGKAYVKKMPVLV